jgi:trk system potassium uptake protein TrkH
LTATAVRATRSRLAVDVLAALNLTAALTKYLALTFALPIGIAIGYGESPWPFVGAAAITAGAAGGLEVATRGKERVGVREGFLVVGLTWIAAAAVAALPYLLSGEQQLHQPIDAYFEAMSGFTTTGASVITDLEGLDRSLMMWRQFTQWLGGMGIIVLALAVLPRLRVGGRQLFESEAPGPEIGGFAASIRETARRLWVLYVALTAVLIAILAAFAWTGVDDRMSFFDAVAHAFATMPTGGFATHGRSMAEFGAATQWVVIVFMALAGMNFALLFLAFARRKPRTLVRDEELRLYVALLLFGSALLAVEVLTEDLGSGEAGIRAAVFQTVSTMTTTGFASADFAQWTGLAVVTIVALMFFGGSAGSTSGSVKVVRHLLIARILRRDLDQTVHPELVSPIRLNRVVVHERTLRAVVAFVLLYVGIFALGALLLAIDAARVDNGVTPFEAVAAAATTLGNVGPGLGFAGPFGSFAPFSDVSKLVMIVLMWLGRLEIIPVAVLFTRAYWRN